MTRKIAALAASLALLASSTSAIAGDNPQDVQTQIADPWIMLTSLSASQTGADAGQPMPPPPSHRRRAAADEFLGTGPVLPVVVWIGLVAIILSMNHDSHFIRPNSPA